MTNFYGNKKDVVEFVRDLLQISEPDLRWITIMPAGKSGVYFVSIVTNTSLEDTVKTMAESYCLTPTTTSPIITLDGSSHLNLSVSVNVYDERGRNEPN